MNFVGFETHFDILRSNNLENSDEKDRDFNDVKRNSIGSERLVSKE